jgi:hypothetical protein
VDTDRLGGRAVGERIAEQVGKQLRDASAVAVDVLRQIERRLDSSFRRTGAPRLLSRNARHRN